jgi:hypothetical protein
VLFAIKINIFANNEIKELYSLLAEQDAGGKFEKPNE